MSNVDVRFVVFIEYYFGDGWCHRQAMDTWRAGGHQQVPCHGYLQSPFSSAFVVVETITDDPYFGVLVAPKTNPVMDTCHVHF
jgi:hypothetical protein